MKKNIALGLALAALTATGAGVAYAATGDGTTTRADVQAHAAAMFAKMDANKDGKLDSADRAAHRSQMFARLDSDGNGSISPAEFAAPHQRGPGAGGERQAGEHRQGMGQGMGGHRMGRHGGGHMGMGGGMMLLRMADTNHDSAVSQAEFTTAALSHFDQADTNKDGNLTREERQAAHQAMRAHMRSAEPRS